MYHRFGKRLLDIVITLILLLVVWPLLCVLAQLVRIKFGSPVLFRQQRPGRNEKPFTIVKFRTMTESREQQGELLPDSERLTDFGRFLRRTSLDELPELLNVLRGEMTLVGPRPLLMRYLPHYSDEQRRRHNVRPGITGWAQVNGRNALSWEEKFQLDVWYVDNCSLWLDVRIIGKTIVGLVRPEGISAPGHATMYYFAGNSLSPNVETKVV